MVRALEQRPCQEVTRTKPRRSKPIGPRRVTRDAPKSKVARVLGDASARTSGAEVARSLGRRHVGTLERTAARRLLFGGHAPTPLRVAPPCPLPRLPRARHLLRWLGLRRHERSDRRVRPVVRPLFFRGRALRSTARTGRRRSSRSVGADRRSPRRGDDVHRRRLRRQPREAPNALLCAEDARGRPERRRGAPRLHPVGPSVRGRRMERARRRARVLRRLSGAGDGQQLQPMFSLVRARADRTRRWRGRVDRGDGRVREARDPGRSVPSSRGSPRGAR
jgi:hypothetical protein